MKRLLFGFLLLATLCQAAPPPITLGSPVSLPAVGLRFRAFREMKPMPLPMPAIRAERRGDGAKLLSNHEYWRFRQTAGVWFNDSCVIRVGTVTIAPFEKPELKPESELLAEFTELDRELPEADKEVLLVLDATTGQNGLLQAKQFKEIAGVTAMALTKLDGTAKGGIVIAVADALQIPVKYIGVGEKAEDLMPFDARDFVDALL